MPSPSAPLRLHAIAVVCLCCFALPALSMAQGSKKKEAPRPHPEEVEVLKGHGGSIRAVEFHPSGNTLFSCGDDAQVICHDFFSIAKDKESVREVSRRQGGERAVAIAFSAKGDVCAFSGVTHWGNGFGAGLQIYTPYREDPFIVGPQVQNSFTCCDVAADGSYVVMGANNNQLRGASLLPKRNKKGRMIADMRTMDAPGIPSPVKRVACHPSQSIVVSGGRGGWVYSYEVTTEGFVRQHEFTREINANDDSIVTGLKFTPDGTNLVVCLANRTFEVYDTRSCELKRSWEPVNQKPLWIDTHPKYTWLIAGFEDGVARIIDFDTGEVLASLEGHAGPVHAACFSPDGKWAATGSEDHMVRVWKLNIER